MESIWVILTRGPTQSAFAENSILDAPLSTEAWGQGALSSISWCLGPGWHIDLSAPHSPHGMAQVLIIVVQQLKGVDLRKHRGAE